MKYLGIDYGTKKVGLALSDDGGTLAFPHSVVPSDAQLDTHIVNLLSTHGIKEVVMGHSLSLGGNENPVMQEAHAFKESLEQRGFVVHLEPEFLTTVQAKRETGDEMADAAAAALILQTFLDKRA